MEKKTLSVKKTLGLYWQQVKHHKISFGLMLVFIPAGALLIDTLLPYFLSQAIGGITENNQDTVTRFLIIAAIIGGLGAVANFIGFQAMVNHESNVINRVRQSTFKSLINKDISFFNNSKVGAMTSRYIDFVRAEVQIQDLFIIRTLGFLLSVGIGLTILAQHSAQMALMITGLIIFLIVQIRVTMRIRQNWRHERKTLVSDIHGAVADSLTNNLIVKTFAGEKREIKNLSTYTDRFGKIYRKDIGFTVAEGSTRVLLMVGVQIISVIMATQMISNGSIDLAIGIFVLAYMQRIGSQIFVLSEILNNFDQAFLDAEPMTKMLITENTINDRPGAVELKSKNPTIELQNASFKYTDGNRNVLDGINLTIKPGEKIGLVGHSGAGKTTITQLLLRFHDVTEGKILIGSQAITDVTQESLRQHIAFVPQEPLLFHRSLKENIAYGNPDASIEEIRTAAKKAHALEFIEKLPDGLETMVGERGVKLSGGQRQRIAIARAILKDAPILILDEATSALDSESEVLIQKALWELMKGRTTIVIAHRLSTIQKMDRIIVLEDGKIAEEGSHPNLVTKQGGIYAKLWAHQSGGFIEE